MHCLTPQGHNTGHEWNRELDTKLKGHNFNHLKSNPCTYIRQKGTEKEIITVWGGMVA
jgi:hypothetical protein